MDSINSVYLCKVLKYPIFMTMKRYSLLLTLLFLPFMLMMGQTSSGSMSSEPIQRSFFKVFTLGGQVTDSEICEVFGIYEMSPWGYPRVEVERLGNDVMSYRVYKKEYFGGYKWDYIDIMTYQDLLYYIAFVNTDNNYDEEELKSQFKDLKEKLVSKYSTPYKEADRYLRWTHKNITSVILKYDAEKNLNLIYLANYYYNQAKESQTDEL